MFSFNTLSKRYFDHFSPTKMKRKNKNQGIKVSHAGECGAEEHEVNSRETKSKKPPAAATHLTGN